jgi:hypothetical protein
MAGALRARMRKTLSLVAVGLMAGCLGGYNPPAGGGSGGGGGGSGNGSGDGSGSSGSGGGGSGGAVTDPAPAGVPAYYDGALPIFQKSCIGCHGEGGTQPRLDQFDQAKANAAGISAAVMNRTMPPFPPEAGCNSYVDERRISASDQQTIVMWAMNGAHAGDPSKAPTYTAPAGANLGTPDKHLSGGPFTPTYPGSAGANDLYWCYVLDPGLTASSDLTALQVVPGTIAQVHHVIVFRDPGGTGSAGKPASGYECNGAPGEMLSGWVPGSGPLVLPAGVGMTIDPSDRLLMQVHYHKDANVTPSPDTTSVDLFFAKSTMPEHAYVVWSGTPLFTIPANTTGYAVNSTCTVNGNWKVLGIAPHMHQHATKFTSNLTMAGANQCLMNIQHWDFGWQGGYFLQTPLNLVSGDKIATTCTYDNSTGSQIKFGEATTDEMCFGFVYVVAAAKPTFSGLVNLFGGADAKSMCAN